MRNGGAAHKNVEAPQNFDSASRVSSFRAKLRNLSCTPLLMTIDASSLQERPTPRLWDTGFLFFLFEHSRKYRKRQRSLYFGHHDDMGKRQYQS